MSSYPIDRRELVTGASAMALLLGSPAFAHAFPKRDGEQLVPFTDAPAAPPRAGFNLQRWEDLDSWITPNAKFFRVAHYNEPQISATDWKLDVAGLVERPRTYSLADLRARPRSEVAFTLECAGNHGLPWFTSGIGNARWAGTPLAPLLAEAKIRPGGIEIVFFGHDEGEETVRDVKMKQSFARSMSVEDAMSPANMLCFEMNGVALPAPHGFPVRLIAPGWYGVANVKWLRRIEVRDTRFMGRFMARDYVTIREEAGGGGFVETSVGRARLKSAPAKVTRKGSDYRIYGVAWGKPIAKVEVQLDGGPWRSATIDPTNAAPYAWRVWTLDWSSPPPGEHVITSRATDTAGNVQPAPSDPVIAGKKTYWESFNQVSRKVQIA